MHIPSGSLLISPKAPHRKTVCLVVVVPVYIGVVIVQVPVDSVC